ncbi:glycine betaine ABC transporter substrate-binding protein [Raineyella sp. W15-4]|nr:glycine betaine ABC transporter substrate-binding protein [Raineyella sp. W15-4]WOQ16354.1 glycine betaine ABC transporter substrate-binding protein [Raineyella sp. W15-4]
MVRAALPRGGSGRAGRRPDQRGPARAVRRQGRRHPVRRRPGLDHHQQNTKRLAAYAPSLKHSTSSEAALIAQLERSYSRKEPILLYFYHPHWLFQKYDLVQLTEPTPYTDGCFDTTGKCAIPTLSAHIAARKDLQQRAPRFVSLLQHVSIPLTDIEAMQQQVDVEKKPAKDVARAWVDAHASAVTGWIG